MFACYHNYPLDCVNNVRRRQILRPCNDHHFMSTIQVTSSLSFDEKCGIKMSLTFKKDGSNHMLHHQNKMVGTLFIK